MKITAYILAASLFAPVLVVLSSSAAAAASLVVVAGLSAIVGSDYGQSAESIYDKVTVDAKPATENLPLAA